MDGSCNKSAVGDGNSVAVSLGGICVAVSVLAASVKSRDCKISCALVPTTLVCSAGFGPEFRQPVAITTIRMLAAMIFIITLPEP